MYIYITYVHILYLCIHLYRERCRDRYKYIEIYLEYI